MINKNNFINKELQLVHMNENEFKILSCIYTFQNFIFLRDIVRKTNLPYGTVQSILKRYNNYFEIKLEGKNKYFKFKKNLNFVYFRQVLELSKTEYFLEKNIKLKKFIEELIKFKIPILIFGSYAKSEVHKNSDLDLIIFSDKEMDIPIHLLLPKVQIIHIKNKNIKKFKSEILFKEIKKNYIIVSGFDFILNEVLNDE